MTQTAEKLLTGEDLLALGPDFHGELVKGRLVEMAPASWGHGITGTRALSIIDGYVRKHRLGAVMTAETGFYLTRDPDTVRAPDVAFVSTARLPAGDDRSGFFDGPPDLAVEVVSPRDSFSELAEKIEDYLAAGTKLVWIVDPAKQTVTTYDTTRRAVVLQRHETLTGGEVLPGFAEPVAQFFE